VGRICRKGKFKAWNEKVKGVMDDESGESMERRKKCHSKNWLRQNWKD